jgi:hypothetical protein
MHTAPDPSLDRSKRNSTLLTGAVVVALLSGVTPAIAAKQTGGVGFTCTASDGAVRRFNIDLRKGRYDAGDGVKSLSRVTDTKIEIEGPNPYLAADPDPYFHSLELDRVSLILTDQVVAPRQGIRRDTQFQCVIGPIIDFTAGRKF